MSDTGNLQGVGYKNPPKDTRFGGPRANKRNTKGRPKSFDALRKLAQQIAAEDDGDFTVVYNMLRRLAKSRSGGDNKTFLEYAYGKPKDELDVTTDGKAITPITVIEIVKNTNEPVPD